MPIVKLETTELNAHVHLISLVMAILDVTLSVQSTTIAPETKYILHNPIYLYQRWIVIETSYIFFQQHSIQSITGMCQIQM